MSWRFAHAIFTPGWDGWLEHLEGSLARKPESIKGYTVGDNTNKDQAKHPWRMDDEQVTYKGYELAVKYGINVVAVVFNDEAFGNVARDLDEAWGGSFAADLKNPDFMKLADAYGVVGMRAEKPTDVGDLVRKALTLQRPVLIEVRVGRMGRPAFFAPLKRLDKYGAR